ncbi:MAG: hypothetical protein QG656_1986, partial [Candidatus Hydrogenedentes bacterium]|nr:hypothetical protein [Candidatus Hydrogenedentota bacterium]
MEGLQRRWPRARRAAVTIVQAGALLFVVTVDRKAFDGGWLSYCFVPLLIAASPGYALAAADVSVVALAVYVWGMGCLPVTPFIPPGVSVQPFYWGAQIAVLAVYAFRKCLWREGFLKCCTAKRSETLRNALLLAGLLLAGRALLRQYPFLPSAAWAAVALICRHSLPSAPAKERSPLRERAATAGLLVLSLGVSVFIVEAGVRLFVEPSYGNAALFEPHPEY